MKNTQLSIGVNAGSYKCLYNVMTSFTHRYSQVRKSTPKSVHSQVSSSTFHYFQMPKSFLQSSFINHLEPFICEPISSNVCKGQSIFFKFLFRLEETIQTLILPFLYTTTISETAGVGSLTGFMMHIFCILSRSSLVFPLMERGTFLAGIFQVQDYQLNLCHM